MPVDDYDERAIGGGNPGGVVGAERFAVGEADEGGGAAGGVHGEFGFGEEGDPLLEALRSDGGRVASARRRSQRMGDFTAGRPMGWFGAGVVGVLPDTMGRFARAIYALDQSRCT